MNFDFTNQGRRPSAAQIVASWRKAGKPQAFTVEYGETFAEFRNLGYRWDDSGNGCRGVDRLAVVKLLNKESDASHGNGDDVNGPW